MDSNNYELISFCGPLILISLCDNTSSGIIIASQLNRVHRGRVVEIARASSPSFHRLDNILEPNFTHSLDIFSLYIHLYNCLLP
jgi:hypothetical protein